MVGPPYTPVFCIRGSVFTESSNHGSCSTVVVTVEKKSAYKWTGVVQGLTVLT